MLTPIDYDLMIYLSSLAPESESTSTWFLSVPCLESSGDSERDRFGNRGYVGAPSGPALLALGCWIWSGFEISSHF